MASEVPPGGHQEGPGGLRGYVRHLLSHATYALPLIAAMASLTLILDTHSDAFRVFDEHVVGFAASRQADHDDINKVFSAWVISPQLFASDQAFKRKLPVDKKALQAVIEKFGMARAVAIDVEAVPQDQIITSVVEVLDKQEHPMFAAVEGLLAKNVHVVLLSSGNQADQVSAFFWRKSFCSAAQKVWTEKQSSARLWWASGYLETQGSGMNVMRYFSPKQAEERVKAGLDGGLMPLGVVLAVAAGEAPSELAKAADYCAHIRDRDKPGPLDKGAPRPADPAYSGKPADYINYFSARPLEVPIDDMDALPQGGPLEVLKRGAVVLGVRTPDGFDVHGTPITPMLGAHLHALVAASVGKPLVQNHGLAYLVDIVVGYLFVVFFHAFQDFRVWVNRRWLSGAPSCRRIVNLTCPLAALLATSVLLIFAPLAAARGLWLNPIPMLLGVMAHLYVELVDPLKPPEVGIWKSFKAWWNDWRNVLALSARSEALAWTLRQAATLGLIGFAMYLLFLGH